MAGVGVIGTTSVAGIPVRILDHFALKSPIRR